MARRLHMGTNTAKALGLTVFVAAVSALFYGAMKMVKEEIGPTGPEDYDTLPLSYSQQLDVYRIDDEVMAKPHTDRVQALWSMLVYMNPMDTEDKGPRHHLDEKIRMLLDEWDAIHEGTYSEQHEYDWLMDNRTDIITCYVLYKSRERSGR